MTPQYRVNHECPYDGAWWATTLAWSADQNAALRDDFEYAVYDDEPSVPCAKHRTFVLHQYFDPPLEFGARSAGAHVLAGSSPTCQAWLPALMERRIIVRFDRDRPGARASPAKRMRAHAPLEDLHSHKPSSHDALLSSTVGALLLSTP